MYRLFERDTCMFSGTCMMSSLQFDITIEAEKKSEIWLIPPKVFRSLMEESTAVSNFMNEIMFLFHATQWVLINKILTHISTNSKSSSVAMNYHLDVTRHLAQFYCNHSEF